MKIAVILGTSKSDGHTHRLAKEFTALSNATVFELTNYNISFYDYAHENRSDDFLSLINKLADFDHIVFASPVYWYCMSAQLKVFFDRLSDLLTIEKTLGRSLKGKSISVLASGYDVECPACFIQPFILTAAYLQMNYKGCEYASIQDEIDLKCLGDVAAKAFKSIYLENDLSQ